jgi:hypothetical protein
MDCWSFGTISRPSYVSVKETDMTRFASLFDFVCAWRDLGGSYAARRTA